MIKLVSIEAQTSDRTIYILTADTKAEVPETGTATLPGTELTQGSVIYTADLDIGILKSDDTWNWIEG
jgi:hypothetical protein